MSPWCLIIHRNGRGMCNPKDAILIIFRVVFDTYRALRRLGLSVDIIPAQVDEIKGRRLIIIPRVNAGRGGFYAQALDASDAVIVYGPRFASKVGANDDKHKRPGY